MNCLDLTSECAYRDESDLPAGSSQLILEVVRTLHRLSAEDAIHVLDFLKAEDNASIILSTLREAATFGFKAPAGLDAVVTTSHAAGPSTIEGQNPTAYPAVDARFPMLS